MADAAISYAVEKLGDALIERVSFLHGVEEKVRWLKDELQSMQCFLKDAAEKQGDDERIRKWISDIREAAHDAEDAIDAFVLKVDAPKKSRGRLGRFAFLPVHVSHLNGVGEEIESIRARLQDIERRRQTYGIQNLGEGTGSSGRIAENVEWHRRLHSLQKDKHVVGLNDDVDLLLQKVILEEKKRGLCIAAIVGMGGIGKSTLARRIYDHAKVVAAFNCRAWVVVSREFAPEDLIKQLILQISTEDEQKVLETMKKKEESTKDKLSRREKLQEMLHEQLEGKSYLIVLDDVWEDTCWDSLRSAFPDEKDKASRLLFTSRNQIITEHQGYIHKMRLLDPDESWELLLKTAFTGKTDCPPELEKIGREISKNCQGLPLAITVAGGLLVNQGESKSGWEKVLKEMNTHFDRSSGNETVSAILELSYHNLPPELKSCFLCLGFFKEGATIRAKRLVHIWVAQGFVPQEGEETMEETARGYLDELINRNVVQVKDMSKDDRVRSIHIHDLLRKLSIRIAKERISFEILRDKWSSQSSQKSRHRAIYCTQERLIESTNQDKHLRSLFVHEVGKHVIACPSSPYWKSFELLKILDMEGCRLEILPSAIGDLIGLRYLGLRYTRISSLPRSLGGLRNLQVLDIQWNSMVKAPNVLWKMDGLRHLYVDTIAHSRGRHLKIGTLKNIQTLTYIQLSDWMMVEHPTEMASLRKLGIVINQTDSGDANKLFASLATLENLVCLNLRMCCALEMDGLGALHRITQLKLRGKMTRLPSASDFPPNLSHLSLIIYTQLDEDPMQVLAKLPNLSYLKLNYAHLGTEMVIADDGFPILEVLSLQKLWVLKNIQVGKGAMPELKQLKICYCPYLKAENLPERLGSVAITSLN